MSVDGRVIVGPADQEEVAVVTIPLPAGGEVEIDPAWRFHGWLRRTERRKRVVRLTAKRTPVLHVYDDGSIEES